MSIVIMGHLFFHLNTIFFLPVAIFVVIVVGLSRLYSRSRFPHQILGSYFLGFVGLLFGMHFCEKMSFHRYFFTSLSYVPMLLLLLLMFMFSMSHMDHSFCVGAVALVIIVGVGMAMENNQSYLLYIPRKEFVRVLAEIVSGGGKGISTNNEDGEEEDDDDEEDESSRLLKEKRRALALKQQQQQLNPPRKRSYVKSDSLYYLQKSLEEREAKIQSEIIMMNPLHGNLAAKNPRNYGKEDFFTSDSEYED